MPKKDTKANEIGQKVAQNVLKSPEIAPWLTGKVPEIATRPPVDASETPPVAKKPKPRKPKATLYDPKVKRSQTRKPQDDALKPAPKKDGTPRKPKYEWTVKHSNRVMNGVAQGFAHDDICAGIKCSKTTMYKYYKAEIEKGKAMALLNVGGRLYEAAKRCGDDASFIPAAKYFENTRGNIVPKTASQVDVTTAGEKLATLPPVIALV